jgi:hypothetical protein
MKASLILEAWKACCGELATLGWSCPWPLPLSIKFFRSRATYTLFPLPQFLFVYPSYVRSMISRARRILLELRRGRARRFLPQGEHTECSPLPPPPVTIFESLMLLFDVKISTQGTLRYCIGAAVDVLGGFCGSLCGIGSSYWVSRMFCIESIVYTTSQKKALMYQNIYCFSRVAFSVLPALTEGNLNLEICLACLIRQSQRPPQMTMRRCY